VSAETAARQQQTADLFYENKLVPKKVDIRALLQIAIIDRTGSLFGTQITTITMGR
jgi:ABC-type nitrate/sulfonate/bicarbonate transport system substrate-binding protein